MSILARVLPGLVFFVIVALSWMTRMPSGPVKPSGLAPRASGWSATTVVSGLEHPWAVVWLPSGEALITEKPGRLRVVRAGQLLPDPVSGLPEWLGRGHGGLMDLALHPRFNENRWVYFTCGHRNIQGLTRDPASGRIWANEHGSRGGDELNLLSPGNNHGWPRATYSIEYTFGVISRHTARPGMTDPLVVWTPAQAPSGLLFYTGDVFPGWKGDLFSGALKRKEVRRTPNWIGFTQAGGRRDRCWTCRSIQVQPLIRTGHCVCSQSAPMGTWAATPRVLPVPTF